jgi:hypothetical protein
MKIKVSYNEYESLPFVLENMMIGHTEEEISKAPEAAQELYRKYANEEPIGISYHPQYGWFVIAAGQGPCICWSENEVDWR